MHADLEWYLLQARTFGLLQIPFFSVVQFDQVLSELGESHFLDPILRSQCEHISAEATLILANERQACIPILELFDFQ